MANSRAQLLDYMNNQPITQGWGAISMFNRGRLNRFLEQQFVAGFNESSFLPSINANNVFLTDDQTEWVNLDSIVLSKPLLSFETASLDNSKATLTLGIMAGTFTLFSKPVGRPATLLSNFKISEQQGFTVVMEINLAMVVGEVDKRGRVMLDLADSLKFQCNLADQLSAQNRIGTVFETFLKTMPRHKRVFELGTLDLKGYNPLTPTHFYIRTQAAPGAKLAKASNYGEGGVLVFISLRGKPSPGSFPSEGSGFPYLIPDDQNASGDDLYSASLVLSEDMKQYVKQDRLDILNSLLFPGENIFVESSRHDPYDLIVFGNLDPTLTSITLDPLFKIIEAGSSLQFNVVQAGKTLTVANVTWTVRSINTTRSAGQISSTGLYTTVARALLGKEVVRNVVTARYIDPGTGEQRQASALVAVAFDGMALSPQSSVNYIVNPPRPLQLAGSTLSEGNLSWTLVEPKFGRLVTNGNSATYIPPVELAVPEGFAVQKIEAQDTLTGAKVQATVLLLEVGQLLVIDPPFVFDMQRSVAVQFTVPTTYPQEYQRWSVFSGGGTVSVSGLFTSPAQFSSPVSVVRCEIVINGTAWVSGYSIIQLSDFVAEPSWDKVVSFKLTAPANNTKAFANGYQQIAIDVEIETEHVNGMDYPITEEEFSTLTIVHRNSGQELDYLDIGQEGFEADAAYQWAVSTESNRFSRSDSVAQAVDENPVELLNGISRRRVFVHTRAADPEVFHARFIDAFFGPHNSNENSDLPPYNIELVPVVVPSFVPGHYDFKPKRVAGGGKNPPEQDDYDYFLRTTDYWSLDYRGVDGRPVRFVRFELEGNQSVVQWESRYQNEFMFSYTGYVFNNEKVLGDEKTMFYDERMSLVVDAYNHPLDSNIVGTEVVGEGQLIIGLFRTDDIRYWSDSRLEAPLRLKLLDKNGNYHQLSIGFAPMSVADSRNTLLLTVL
ncbi:hypothetical protein [Pseudomonas sp. UMAB-08]|uniref:hypothetical protein n=1 Tax=Pseudomonas sp. UMAB-08 TaxID=1365375 RepID=UPI001C593321|nr:hypothetical protein [Pseudomonas sp. UMAB-08]